MTIIHDVDNGTFENTGNEYISVTIHEGYAHDLLNKVKRIDLLSSIIFDPILGIDVTYKNYVELVDLEYDEHDKSYTLIFARTYTSRDEELYDTSRLQNTLDSFVEDISNDNNWKLFRH